MKDLFTKLEQIHKRISTEFQTSEQTNDKSDTFLYDRYIVK